VIIAGTPLTGKSTEVISGKAYFIHEFGPPFHLENQAVIAHATKSGIPSKGVFSAFTLT